jgi:hypothetical protein
MSDLSPNLETPKNLISEGWLNLNLLWEESEIVRGLTGAILGALLTAPWGDSHIMFIGIGLGAFASPRIGFPGGNFSLLQNKSKRSGTTDSSNAVTALSNAIRKTL